MIPVFPFTAIVGQELMRSALVLTTVEPRIGGVLIRGERGTGKSIAARGLAALLPPLRVVEGCRFKCDPDRPVDWCTECKERFQGKETIPYVERPTPFVNLPISATEDRVVGTLDIEAALQKGERKFDAGILAAANRGILYIDEVNLLDDHVVDVLLDAAAMGVNIVEREGISFSHPARFVLVGTMNPEEGDLRPQLTDRFALSVDIHGIRNPEERVAVIRRCLRFEANPFEFNQIWQARESELSQRISTARQLVEKVTYRADDLFTIANLTAKFNVDGHRADFVILKTARAHAAFDERLAVAKKDILFAAKLALPHRLKRHPFQNEAMVNPADLHKQLSEMLFPPVSQAAVAEQPPEDDPLFNEYKDPNSPWKDFIDLGLR
jgi:Mg-chelatase subunit ChlI